MTPRLVAMSCNDCMADWSGLGDEQYCPNCGHGKNYLEYFGVIRGPIVKALLSDPPCRDYDPENGLFYIGVVIPKEMLNAD